MTSALCHGQACVVIGGTVDFVLPRLVSAERAAGLVAAAKAVAARRGWESGRHKAYPTTDVVASDTGGATYAELRRAVEEAVMPAMAERKHRWIAAPGGDRGLVVPGRAVP